MLSTTKSQMFNILVDNAGHCTLCARMHGRTRVLSQNNGNIDARILFIGEAPGRLGADRTGIPFYGDQTGRNFERLLLTAGLTRREVFITNSVLCNPRNEKGNNSPPTKLEIKNCSVYLRMLLNIIHPEIIVPLGQAAISALNVIASHGIELRRDVGKPISWIEYTILPMYHPGPRTAIHRNPVDQRNDFSFLGELCSSNLLGAFQSELFPSMS